MLRQVVRAAAWFVIAAWIVGALMQGRSVVVLGSTSMEPWGSPGDLLIHRVVPADQIETGDVITVERDRGLATQRVIRIDQPLVGVPLARIQGDASPLPEAVPVPLTGEIARVQYVVPEVGVLLTDGAPLLWGSLLLLLLGAVGVAVTRREHEEAVPLSEPSGTEEPAPPVTPDPRVEALLASIEQFLDDGLHPLVATDLLRVRVGALLGLPSAEDAVRSIDLGSQFYVVALADADADALAHIPLRSRRRVEATAALARWWDEVATDRARAVEGRLDELQP